MSLPCVANDGQIGSHKKASRSSLLRVARVRHTPISDDELRRQLFALFDTVGLRDELFDRPEASSTINSKQ